MKTQTQSTPIPEKYTTKDRQYRLKGGKAPLELILPNRNTHRAQLLHFDEKERRNRALRYSQNQRTPFEDEQDDHVILGTIIFENGFLNVPKTNPVLQWFLDLHPLKDKKFEEVNMQREAKEELDIMDLQDKADNAVKDMGNDERKQIACLVFGGHKVNSWNDEQIFVAMRRYARMHPKDLLAQKQDAQLEEKSFVQQLFDAKLLRVKFGDKVMVNAPEGMKAICTIPKHGKMSAEQTAHQFLYSAEGEAMLAYLENALSLKNKGEA